MIADVLSGAARWTVEHGDTLDVMRSMPSASVHLAYLDPGYHTQRAFYLPDGSLAFDDRWPSFEAYVAHTMARCEVARDILTHDGNFILHVDPTVSHYLKVALDGIFGLDCFRNEIVWRYRRWPAKSRQLQKMHDTLLWYSRTAPGYKFNVLYGYESLAASTLKTFGNKKQRADFSSGHRKPSVVDNETTGPPLSDVWDIGVIAPIGKERTGWPTQKPRALTDRLILALTDPDDLVCEVYGGACPLLSSALAHGRSGVAIDNNLLAVEMATARLRAEDEARRDAARAALVACLKAVRRGR